MKSDTAHMKMVVNGTNAQQAATSAVPVGGAWPLIGSEADLYDTIMGNYILRHKSKHRAQTTIDAIAPVIKDIVRTTGKAPWRWSEEDFESWSATHTDAGNKSNTLHSYQGIARRYLEYIYKNAAYTFEIRRRYDIVFDVVAHEGNCVTHATDDNTNRLMLEDGHFDSMMTGIDEAIKEAVRTNSKNYWPLLRDKVMFALWHSAGIRDSELLGINKHSFSPNDLCPRMEKFGIVKVCGKGNNGSGLRYREVPLTHPALPFMLESYINEVRPNFLKINNPDETALFLSQRGTRLKIGTLNKRFHEHLDRVDLDDIGYVPYSLRHSSVTNKRRSMSLHAVMAIHGHQSGEITERYTHFTDSEIDEEISDYTNRRLDGY